MGYTRIQGALKNAGQQVGRSTIAALYTIRSAAATCDVIVASDLPGASRETSLAIARIAWMR